MLGRPKAGRGRPKGGSKKEEKELPRTVEELRKATGPLKLWARPVIHAYDALMKRISDEALDENERQMGEEAVAAVLWYYGITHPLALALIFVGSTTARRLPAVVEKARKPKAVPEGIPGSQPVTRLRAAPPAEVTGP